MGGGGAGEGVALEEAQEKVLRRRKRRISDCGLHSLAIFNCLKQQQLRQSAAAVRFSFGPQIQGIWFPEQVQPERETGAAEATHEKDHVSRRPPDQPGE